MRERKVREIMARYLAEIGETFSVQKGAGPDILRNGAALEVKGTHFPLKKALKQFAEYAFGYRDLAIALPLASVGLRLLCELYVLEKAMQGNRSSRRRFITLYIVAESANQTYSILEFASVGGLLWRLLETLGEESRRLAAGRRLEERPGRAVTFLSQSLDDRLRSLLRQETDSLFAYELRKP